MAIRPVYVAIDAEPYVRQVDVNFKFYSGFSVSQKQKSFKDLHKEFMDLYSDYKILEVSSKSDVALGVKLSAFNLSVKTSVREFTVESAFQSSKVFENGGPYIDLLEKSSREAKKDGRLKNSGRLVGFNYFGKTYPLEPKDFFYNWLYINSLVCNKPLIDELMNYTAFTDIEFNPEKSINCQAKAVALFVSLNKKGLIEKALKSQNDFLNVVYKSQLKNEEFTQTELQFDNFDKHISTNNNDLKHNNISKKSSIVDIYSSEFSEISYLLHNLENGKIYENTGWSQDGYLSTNIKKLRKELVNLLCKIQGGDKSDKEMIREALDSYRDIK